MYSSSSTACAHLSWTGMYIATVFMIMSCPTNIAFSWLRLKVKEKAWLQNSTPIMNVVQAELKHYLNVESKIEYTHVVRWYCSELEGEQCGKETPFFTGCKSLFERSTVSSNISVKQMLISKNQLDSFWTSLIPKNAEFIDFLSHNWHVA